MSGRLRIHMFYWFQYTNLPTVKCRIMHVRLVASSFFRVLSTNEKVIKSFFNFEKKMHKYFVLLMLRPAYTLMKHVFICFYVPGSAMLRPVYTLMKHVFICFYAPGSAIRKSFSEVK